MAGAATANYWVVGAMWGGHDDHLEEFVRRGHWHLGWADEDQPGLAASRAKILPGDRIAIKRMLGQGAREIEIRALGVVTENDHEEKRVYVRWAVWDLRRTVESKGCFGSIHGPFGADAQEWIRRVFQL